MILTHLHPVSLIFELVRIIRQYWIAAVAAFVGARSGSFIGLSIGSMVLGIAVVSAVIRYVTFRYGMDESNLHVHQGLIDKQNRIIPLSRIQNIDLSQNLFHRLLRVGEVRVETSSGKEPEAVMRVLSLLEYERLKAKLINHQSELLSTPTAEAPPTAERSLSITTQSSVAEPQTILVIPTYLIAIAGLISNRGEVIAGLLIGLIWQFRMGESFLPWGNSSDKVVGFNDREMTRKLASDGSALKNMMENWNASLGGFGSIVALLVGLLLLFFLLRIFSAIWYVIKFHNYRLDCYNKTLHLSCGLLTKVTATIPLGRVQLISVQRSWLMRRLGLASIRIETAGGVGASEDSAGAISRKWFVPIVDNANVAGILRCIDDRIAFQESSLDWKPLALGSAARMFRPILLLGLLVSGAMTYFAPMWGWSIGLVVIVLGYRWAKKKSASRRYARTPWGIVFRSGLLRQKCSITFVEKIQGIKWKQSPFDRRWKMAALAIDTASAGPADHRIDVHYLDQQFAANELEHIQQWIGLS
jgi:putative membrane protein